MGNYLGKRDRRSSSSEDATSSHLISPCSSSSSSSISAKRKRSITALTAADDDSSSTSDDSESAVDDLQNSINLILNYTQSSRDPSPLSVRSTTATTTATTTASSELISTFMSAASTSSPTSPSTSTIVTSTSNKRSSSDASLKSSVSKSRIRPELVKPSRKKMKSTSNYIYNTLFVNGENSDICVRALGREWHLHKLYLCQSPYFESMFKDSQWRESNERVIEMSIPDENITERSLEIALGSFYREEIALVPIEVISVLACASLFSLEGLLAECESVMLDNVNAQTVLAYYDAALLYGVVRVADKCLKWLAINLMTCDELRLESMGVTLLEKVLGFTKHLMIIQVETDLYSLCKKWLFYQLTAEKGNGAVVKLDPKSWQKTTNEFFKSLLPTTKSTNEQACLFDNEAYSKYANIFRKIRLQSIVNDLQSVRLIIHDRIIPKSWIEPYLVHNWLNLLFVDQDKLSNDFEIDPNDFDNSCLRFGRILSSDSPGTWRWIGFNYGIDLLMVHTNRTLSLKRNTSTMHSPYKGLLSNRTVVRFYYVLKLVELDANGNEVWSKRTEPTCFDMHKNEEKTCLTIEPKVKYPLVLNLFLLFSPAKLNYLNQSE